MFTTRPGWTMFSGNPDASAADGAVYMVETSAGAVLRCIGSVFWDDGRDVISFHRIDNGEEVDAIQFVSAIPKQSDAVAVRPDCSLAS